MRRAIYLDYQATSPCDQRVFAAMQPYFCEKFGNPSSTLNTLGREARESVNVARDQVAGLLGCEPGEIVFTGSATESINLAIQGTIRAAQARVPLRGRRRLITIAIERREVLGTVRRLENDGWPATVLPVDRSGVLEPDNLRGALSEDVLLVSFQAANQEIATLQAIDQMADITHHYGAVFHCDASQAVGKIPVDINDLDVDLLSFSGHKIYGPKGVGVLCIRNGAQGTALEPTIHGGGQEYGLRSGTEPSATLRGPTGRKRK